MDRVSTAGSYQSVLLSLMSAESAQNQAQQEVATGKIATDLKGYAAAADTLTATQAISARISTHIQTAGALKDQLSAQNQALSSLADAAGGASKAVSEALAVGDGSTLMTSLQAALAGAASALNVQYDGAYLFSGGATTTAPVSATQLTDLTQAGGVAAVFQNGQTAQVSRLDDTTTVTTGLLAGTVGTPLFTALQTVQAYVNLNGPFSSPLTSAQTQFLQNALPMFTAAVSGVNDVVAQNGVVQQQVDTSLTSLKDQQTTLANAVGDLTNADAAQAATNLQLAQTALQASAQVFSTLKSASLLGFLGNGA